MKQEEKSKISKERIRNAAIKEFGLKSYENVSLNYICKTYKISKGLIYHYFENKDELYLSCVSACFDSLRGFLEKEIYRDADFKVNLKKYLDARHQFFYENPNYSNIFLHTIVQPPAHLREEIKQRKENLTALNLKHYEAIVNSLTLREGISKADAMEYFCIFMEMFQNYFQDYFKNETQELSDFEALMEIHELRISKIISIMLYGIAKEI